ncbi:hypothetical protein A9Q92_05745 [Methylophaga sp. 42_8_T64]|nr:hypothetical protein A9Q92_05745 [Methylophaga sp. 42_8_T64]
MSSKKVIFAVDDESYMSRSYRDIFQDEYDLHFFDSSAEVLKSLDTLKPDLAIIDIGLDEMDGYELCEALKQKEGLEHIPVVFVTGRDFSEDQGRAFFSGGAEYLMKPVEANKIRHLVTKLLHDQPSP